MDIKIGVPQGSCLGPMLFLLYKNELLQAVKNSTIAMFTDDTSISYRVVKSWNCLPFELKQASSLKVFKAKLK